MQQSEIVVKEQKNQLRQAIELAFNDTQSSQKSFLASKKQVEALEETLRIIEACDRNEKIAICGDYDADGITSTVSELNILDGVTATTTELNTIQTSMGAGSVTYTKLSGTAAKLVTNKADIIAGVAATAVETGAASTFATAADIVALNAQISGKAGASIT